MKDVCPSCRNNDFDRPTCGRCGGRGWVGGPFDEESLEKAYRTEFELTPGPPNIEAALALADAIKICADAKEEALIDLTTEVRVLRRELRKIKKQLANKEEVARELKEAYDRRLENLQQEGAEKFRLKSELKVALSRIDELEEVAFEAENNEVDSLLDNDDEWADLLDRAELPPPARRVIEAMRNRLKDVG